MRPKLQSILVRDSSFPPVDYSTRKRPFSACRDLWPASCSRYVRVKPRGLALSRYSHTACIVHRPSCRKVYGVARHLHQLPRCLFWCRVSELIDAGLVGSTGFHSSHPQGNESGRGTTTAEDVQRTPTQSEIRGNVLPCSVWCHELPPSASALPVSV